MWISNGAMVNCSYDLLAFRRSKYRSKSCLQPLTDVILFKTIFNSYLQELGYGLDTTPRSGPWICFPSWRTSIHCRKWKTGAQPASTRRTLVSTYIQENPVHKLPSQQFNIILNGIFHYFDYDVTGSYSQKAIGAKITTQKDIVGQSQDTSITRLSTEAVTCHMDVSHR